MELTIAERIRLIMQRQGITISQIADGIGMSRQNLSNKFSRNSFSFSDVETILSFLNYHVEFMPNGREEKE